MHAKKPGKSKQAGSVHGIFQKPLQALLACPEDFAVSKLPTLISMMRMREPFSSK